MLSQNDAIVPTLLTEVAQNLQSLFFTGIQDRNGSLIEQHLSDAKGTSNFSSWMLGPFNEPTKTKAGFTTTKCAQNAGQPSRVPNNRHGRSAEVVDSLYKDDPWRTEPPLNLAPHASTCKSSLYKTRLLPHVEIRICPGPSRQHPVLVKLAAVFRLRGSAIQVYRRAPGPGAQPLYHVVHGRTQVFHDKAIYVFQLTSQEVLAFSVAQWKGGSDTVLVMMFLDFFLLQCLQSVRDPSHQVLLQAMHQTVRGGPDFIGVLHSHPLFLTRSCASFMHRSGLKLLKGQLRIPRAWLSFV